MLAKPRLGLLSCIFAVTLLVGCAPAPIRNVGDAPVRVSRSPVTQAEIGTAIQRAGASLGWVMLEQGPGKITATLRLRDHVAVVDVTYNTSKYSIQYHESTNLNYNAEKGTIHRSYNGWIANLDTAIQRELALI